MISDHAVDGFLSRVAAIDGIDDLDDLGVQRLGRGVAIQPGRFIEMATRHVFDHLNSIMAATDLKRLNAEGFETTPPTESTVFTHSRINNALALGGLGDLVVADPD